MFHSFVSSTLERHLSGMLPWKTARFSEELESIGVWRNSICLEISSIEDWSSYNTSHHR